MEKLYSTKEAAAALGMTLSGIWYHIQHGHLTPVKVGNTLVLTQAQLDTFTATRRPAGRPTKNKEQ